MHSIGVVYGVVSERFACRVKSLQYDSIQPAKTSPLVPSTDQSVRAPYTLAIIITWLPSARCTGNAKYWIQYYGGPMVNAKTMQS